ncbi:class-II aminoacyl-tRNA synthetase family protein [Spiroplasma taiwanense]|uniref:Asparagine synthetase AsnA n=1 Tax=Spiroplasma taiwanense CT-1 TaxID=1276220 RepID=S5LVV9_9MOLU|nr:asparagine synthetase AsnA [Spiroplasma taiwanense]AGR40716.1 asparagine synthetase AsnA [Spiroplasma taiwanense CT-1]
MKFGITLGYVSKLNIGETIEGIEIINELLNSNLKKQFSLISVKSGLVTNKQTWLNDDFQQTKRPIDFDIISQSAYGEIIQANNKWRRYFLMLLENINPKKGIITNFTTVNRDVKVDNVNSIVFEEVGLEILANDINIEILNDYLISIYKLFCKIDNHISSKFSSLSNFHFSKKLTFITYKKLKELYPLLTFNERLNKFAKDNGSFVIQDYAEKVLGQKNMTQFSEDVFNLKTYSKLYIYNGECEKAISLVYAGYQVDRKILKEQNKILKENSKNMNEYNHLIKSNELPLTLSIGILTNRFIMTLLEKQHIGEVHSSIWSNDFISYCRVNGIKIF